LFVYVIRLDYCNPLCYVGVVTRRRPIDAFQRQIFIIVVVNIIIVVISNIFVNFRKLNDLLMAN